MRFLPVACALVFGSIAGVTQANPAASGGQIVRVGHYQCVCHQGDFEANLKTFQRGIAAAVAEHLDIVSFPECYLTGYYAKEADARANAFSADSPQMGRVLAVSEAHDLMILVGFNELRGPDIYNTVVVIERGKLVGRYSKALPYEGYFAPGRDFPVFEKKGLKFGIVICSDGGYIEPTRILALKGARFIFAPHFNFVSDPIEHFITVRHDHIARAVENGVHFLRANNVVEGDRLTGLRDGGTGYGDSYVIDPNGEMVAAAGLFHERLMTYAVDLDQKYRAHYIRRSVKSAADLMGPLQEALEPHRTKPPKAH